MPPAAGNDALPIGCKAGIRQRTENRIFNYVQNDPKAMFFFCPGPGADFFVRPERLAAFTIEDEKKLGREIYDKLDRNAFLLKDPKLNAYVTGSATGSWRTARRRRLPSPSRVQQLRHQRLRHAGRLHLHQQRINHGGGKRSAAGRRHGPEIAHANCRHVASIIEKSQKLNIAMLAAIIAGALSRRRRRLGGHRRLFHGGRFVHEPQVPERARGRSGPPGHRDTGGFRLLSRSNGRISQNHQTV